MPLNKLTQKVEAIEENNEKMEQEVENIKEDTEKMEQKVEKLQDNLGVLEIYKEIIRSNKQANMISIIAIVMLFILVFILTITLVHNEKEFTAYRENSISKTELINILKLE